MSRLLPASGQLRSCPLANEGLQRASAEQGDEAGEHQQRAALRGDAMRVAAIPAETKHDWWR